MFSEILAQSFSFSLRPVATFWPREKFCNFGFFLFCVCVFWHCQQICSNFTFAQIGIFQGGFKVRVLSPALLCGQFRFGLLEPCSRPVTCPCWLLVFGSLLAFGTNCSKNIFYNLPGPAARFLGPSTPLYAGFYLLICFYYAHTYIRGYTGKTKVYL